MWNISRHYNNLSGRSLHLFSSNSQGCLAIYDVNDGIVRTYVLAKPLAFIESKQRDCSCGLIQYGFANDRIVGIVNELS